MIPIPAIDLKDGRVVRLLQGNFKEEKVYFEKAEEVAKLFESEGAARLHVVDLDGALKGEPKNFIEIEQILKAVRMPVEVGGGIRDLETCVRYFEMGVRWVILGTKACLDKGFLREAVEEFGEKIILGIDALNGYIATDAWTKVTKIKAVDFIKEIEGLGVRQAIYTDISKDGALVGPNVEQIKHLSENVKMDVIASGGIGSLADLKKLIALKQKNISGVIIGKALYEKKFNLKEAVDLCLQNA